MWFLQKVLWKNPLQKIPNTLKINTSKNLSKSQDWNISKNFYKFIFVFSQKILKIQIEPNIQLKIYGSSLKIVNKKTG